VNVEQKLLDISGSKNCAFSYDELQDMFKTQVKNVKRLYPDATDESVLERGLSGLIKTIRSGGRTNKVPWIVVRVFEGERYDMTATIKKNPQLTTIAGDYACYNGLCSRFRKVVKESTCQKCQASNTQLSIGIAVDNREKAPSYNHILEEEEWGKAVKVMAIPLNQYNGSDDGTGSSGLTMYHATLRGSYCNSPNCEKYKRGINSNTCPQCNTAGGNNADISLPPVAILPASISPSDKKRLNFPSFAFEPKLPEQDIDIQSILSSDNIEKGYIDEIGGESWLDDNTIEQTNIETYFNSQNKDKWGYIPRVAVKGTISRFIDSTNKEGRNILGMEMIDGISIDTPKLVGWYSPDIKSIIDSIGLDFNSIIMIGRVRRNNKVYDPEQAKWVDGQGDFSMSVDAVKTIEKGTRIDTQPPTVEQLSPPINSQGTVKVGPQQNSEEEDGSDSTNQVVKEANKEEKLVKQAKLVSNDAKKDYNKWLE
tara:strand:- start:1843 stop:3285 length:1443 start_codon:yes stop_codon:yes gene_type:complete